MTPMKQCDNVLRNKIPPIKYKNKPTLTKNENKR